MLKSDGALILLQSWPFIWAGPGINHEHQKFNAVVVARTLLSGSAIAFWFRALGEDGANYHEEFATISADSDANLIAQSISNNIPVLQQFIVQNQPAGGNQRFGSTAFIHGTLGRRDEFREVISLEPVTEQSIKMIYSWAMPGEAMIERSSVLLTQVQSEAPDGSPLR